MKMEELIEKSKKITCREAHSQMEDYIRGRLSERELLSYLRHVGDCPHCYDELETEFMITRTVEYLNEDISAEHSFDLTPLLKMDMERNKELLMSRRRRRKIRMGILFVTLLLVVLVFLDLTGIFRVTAGIDLFLRSLGI